LWEIYVNRTLPEPAGQKKPVAGSRSAEKKSLANVTLNQSGWVGKSRLWNSVVPAGGATPKILLRF
jgi:hypothetical protein